MTEIKTYCDKCGKELVSTGDYEDTDIEIDHYYKRVDLCASCFEKLTDMVEDFFKKESEGAKPMNELKPEDVIKALAWYEVVSKNIGSVTVPYDEIQAIADLLREKDATIADYILQIAEMQKQIATQDRILTDFMKRKEIEADKDAEIERLKKRLQHLFISKTIQAYDELDIRTKEYVKDIYSFDAEMNCERERAIKEFLKAIEDAISNLEYNAKLKRKTVTVDMLLDQVNWVLHTVVPRRIKQLATDLLDDFPNCKISGCEAARKDCHLGCPYGKENTSENS